MASAFGRHDMSPLTRFLFIGIVLLGAYPQNGRADQVCAAGDILFGIDVNNFTGSIDWSSVASDGVVFAYIRVANGLDPDFRFPENWAGARQAGVLRGAVQVLHPDLDAVDQAQILVDAIGTLAPGDLPPALAVERSDGQDPATIAAKVEAWLDHVEIALGLAPVIYTGRYFWQDNVGSSSFAGYLLWIADYSSLTCPNLPTQWTDWSFRQDSSTGAVDGIDVPVNTNVFNGDLAVLEGIGMRGEIVFGNGFEGAPAG